MTPEGTVIDGGLGPSLLTPVPFACGLCPDLFGPGAVLVPDIADPGAVAVVGVGFTMCTDGVTVGCIPDTLPRRPSSKPAVEPRRPSVTPTLDTLPRRLSIKAFCFCLTDNIACTCSIAVGSSRCIVKPIATGEIGVEEPVCTSGLCAEKRAVGGRQVGCVERDTANCHSSPFRRRVRGGPRERRRKCCDIID